MPTTERAGVERPNRAPRRTSSALSNLSPAGSGLLRSTHKQHSSQRQASRSCHSVVAATLQPALPCAKQLCCLGFVLSFGVQQPT